MWSLVAVTLNTLKMRHSHSTFQCYSITCCIHNYFSQHKQPLVELFSQTITTSICCPKKTFFKFLYNTLWYCVRRWCRHIQHPYKETFSIPLKTHTFVQFFQLEIRRTSLWSNFKTGVVFELENNVFTIRRKMSRKQVMLFRDGRVGYDKSMRSTGCLEGVTGFLLKSFSVATKLNERVLANLF